MRSKFLTTLLATGMLMSVAGVSTAHHQDGHDANAHGKCTAYFSGSENGQDKKRENGNSFIVFAERIGDQDGDDDTDAYDIALWCNETTGGFGNPGGGNEPSFEGATCPEGEEEQCEDLENQEGGTTPGESNGNNKNKGDEG